MPSNHRNSSFQREKHQGDAIQTVEVAPTTCQLTPMVANIHQPRIPEPQAMRVKLKYISGQTVRSISRSESLARRTVARVVQCEDVQDYVARLREQFYSLGDAALDAVRHALVEGKDARLGFEILKSIGVIPTNEQALQVQKPMGDEDARVRHVMVKMASIAIERNRVFNTPLPDVDAVEGEIEEELQRQNEK